MFNKERGDSLLEVVISTVIMGIIGVLMVSSIAVAKPFANKMSLVGQTVQNLNSLAESINLQPLRFATQSTQSLTLLQYQPQILQPLQLGLQLRPRNWLQ